MKKIISRAAWCLAAGILLGEGSVHIAYLKLAEFYDNTISKITGSAVLNIVFVNKNYKILDYLDITDITVLMLPVMFLIFGLIMTADYLRIPPKIVCFLAGRTGNIIRLKRFIYGNTTKYIVLYVISYVFTIGICSGLISDLSVMSMSIVYILALVLVSKICLIIYISSNGGVAVIYAAIIILLMYLIDIYINSAHIVLYETGRYQLKNIITLLSGLFLINITNRILIKRRDIYVV